MRRKRFTFLLLIAGLWLAQPAPPVGAQSADAIFQSVNRFRVNNGLPPFGYNGRLATAAQRQANYMAEFNIFTSHVGYGGSTPTDRVIAAGYGGRIQENIVGGTRMSADRGVVWWSNSPVHYAALVSTRYVEAGAGFANDGRNNYYVLVVGTPAERPSVTAGVADDSPPPLIITPITLARPRADGSIVHVVQEGQALWSLAAHYDVPLSRLLLFNALDDDALVRPGDEITIRLADGAVPPPTPTPSTIHTVRAGQSLWSIAILYDVKFGDLLWLNRLSSESLLRPGDEVKIRLAPGEAPPPTPTPITFHTVTTGQTLWEVALTYNLTLDQLLAYNNIARDALIRPGDALRIRPETTPAFPPTFTPAPRSTIAESSPATAAPPGDGMSPTTTAVTALASAITPAADLILTPTPVTQAPPSSPLTTFFIAVTAAVLLGLIFTTRRP